MEIEEKDEIPEKIMGLSKELGLFGLSIPEEYGRLGVGMVGKCAASEIRKNIIAAQLHETYK